MLLFRMTHFMFKLLRGFSSLLVYELEDFIITFGVEYIVENHRMVYFKQFSNLGCVKN